eukprot:CAMPEP_0202858680 /NCGR_PEP_ID=MMETSP1391-20130828/1105_1 /ASSEMBLY_ACC=CAM_ASM_000867 /TAXON_ID=1034604 /ORGANISM="Chlamydomonas leiostraca, Strain SAG 11-49" /LENGTH=55 /DNA_ID=CAMNT_0049537619 /DNA_START=165 /DNA_END=332 /DNA_ORIENTATION=+
MLAGHKFEHSSLAAAVHHPRISAMTCRSTPQHTTALASAKSATAPHSAHAYHASE